MKHVHACVRGSCLCLLVLGCGGDEPPGPPPVAAARANAEPAPLRALAGLRKHDVALWTSAASHVAARALERALPELASGALSLGDAASGVGVDVWLDGAQPVAALGSLPETRVYPEAWGAGTTLVFRSAAARVEDYVAFDAPPPAPELRYQLALSSAVAGLRLVENSLELLDASGAPRLRVSPPDVLGADGLRSEARLQVEGCAVDEQPAAPWGRAPTPIGAGACVLVVAWDEARVAYPAIVDPAWSTTGDLASERERFDLSVLASGLVLAAGGLSRTGEALASAELYDPTSGTWATTGSLAHARAEHRLARRSSGRVLAVGGRANGAALSSVEVYDPASGGWSEGAALPAGYAGHAAATLSGGELLIAGGNLPEALRYSDASAAWSSAGSLLASEPDATLTPLSDNRALLVGPNAPAAQIYDLRSGAWSAAPAPAFPRSGHSATRLGNGRVLIAGGHLPSNDGAAPASTQSAEVFEPVTASWQEVGATLERHAFHTATLLPNGRVALVGAEATERGAVSELYDPTWGTWTLGPRMLAPRARHGAALLGDGTLLIAGGVLADSALVGAPSPTPPLADGGAPVPSDAGAVGASSEDTVLGSAERLDPTLPATLIREYKQPARRDRDVTADAVTELWAAITRPAQLEAGRRYPVLLFLHGNHATCGTGASPRADTDCTYTETGVCPAGFTVVPSHRGYDYMTAELAARGYIVVSVNANRGINCGDGDGDDFSMNLARGRLLLRHLQRLSEWNRGVAATPSSVGVNLTGKLDLSQVGILGHSRGGEGARAAYEQYRDPGSPWPARIVEPITLRAIFEIGPVDGQTPRTLNADGVAWAVLLPMCDGDVMDLEGVRPFDRSLGFVSEDRDALKSTLTAWGANHNFFNTQWQVSDSFGCQDHRPLFGSSPGSAEQRQIALSLVLDFFLANVGDGVDPRRNDRFDPALDVDVQTRIDRGYTPGISLERAVNLEDFRAPGGLSMRRLPFVVSGVSVTHGQVPEHDPGLRAALVRWSGNDEHFIEIHFVPEGESLDLRGYDSFDVRLDRAPDAENPPEPTALEVQLLGADGALSPPLSAADYGVRLDGPGGGPFGPHSMLQTLRIPLDDFGAGLAAAVRGVRFSVPKDSSGALFIANLRASVDNARAGSSGDVEIATLPPLAPPAAPTRTRTPSVLSAPPPLGPRALASRQVISQGNRVVSLRSVGLGAELELVTREPFEARDDVLVLDIGALHVARARHPHGDLARVVFSLSGPELARVRDGDPVSVRYATNRAREWDFGVLDTSRLLP